MFTRNLNIRLVFFSTLVAGLFATVGSSQQSSESSGKPVFLYSHYFNAEGENRYPADGSYSEFIKVLEKRFEVRVNTDPLNAETLADVDVVLIANPNDKAVEGFAPPHHVDDVDIESLTQYIENGGGLITAHNQANHNLETLHMNRLLARFGIKINDEYTDVKAIRAAEDTPIIGGLTWGYIIGDSIEIDSSHPASPRAIVTNDVSQKPLIREDNSPGILLATAEPGKGRVVTITDSGWLTNEMLTYQPFAGVHIKEHDNAEIALRLALWAAGQ